MRWIKPLGNIVVPAILFYAAYRIGGIIPAVTLSLSYSIISAIYSKQKYHRVKNSQIVGIFGLIGSATAILFTGEERLYYIPSIVENIIYGGFMTLLSIRHKSVLHFLAKDFEIQWLKQIPEESMLGINVVWLIYFGLKIISKVLGILYLDFNQLYWVVFLLGDPMTVLVILLSVILIRTRRCP